MHMFFTCHLFFLFMASKFYLLKKYPKLLASKLQKNNMKFASFEFLVLYKLSRILLSMLLSVFGFGICYTLCINGATDFLTQDRHRLQAAHSRNPKRETAGCPVCGVYFRGRSIVEEWPIKSTALTHMHAFLNTRILNTRHLNISIPLSRFSKHRCSFYFEVLGFLYVNLHVSIFIFI